MDTIEKRLSALRSLMAQKGLDAYLVVSDDFHSSEYVSGYFKCREYITGFTGSAGTALIFHDRAYLWTDSRYFIQAASELSGTEYILMKSGEKDVPTVTGYLKKLGGIRLGADARTLSASVTDELSEAGAELCDEDLIGMIWGDRPAFPHGGVWELDVSFCGRTRADKLSDVRRAIKDGGAASLFISALDEIAWLFNIRGSDIEYTPLAIAYAAVTENSAVLFLSGEPTAELRAGLEADGVEIWRYDDACEAAASLPQPVMADRSSVSGRLYSLMGRTVNAAPIQMMKAVKNKTECDNMRKAHTADGAAVTKLIYRLKRAAADGSITELTELRAADILETLRKQGEGYLYQSFAPIAAYGAHGAIVHYDPDETTDIPLENRGFILLDTGGQYLTGTTDVTRTVSLGTLSEKERRAYTAVLRGNLCLAAAVFRYGTTGANLDVLARSPLWEEGLDYGHGTGHGVGFLSCVHEGPNAIRMKRADTPFEEGMITSDEPGVYIEEEFGIRLENLILCREKERVGDMRFMCFETLTLVPFDRAAIVPDMLTDREKRLLDLYHARVNDALSPLLDEDERAWLEKETAPIA
ncbi:MAG: aminopeptidase P family protein [Oscillospiraceae bacterium]|nr:aminopeptidase P family protein [Oscillospiraceae bacterium]